MHFGVNGVSLQFLNLCINYFAYFSLGCIIKQEHFTEQKRKEIENTDAGSVKFASQKQRQHFNQNKSVTRLTPFSNYAYKIRRW